MQCMLLAAAPCMQQSKASAPCVLVPLLDLIDQLRQIATKELHLPLSWGSSILG